MEENLFSTPYLEFCVQFWVFHYNTLREQWFQQWALNIIWGLEHLNAEKLWVNLKSRYLRGEFPAFFKYLMEVDREDGARLFLNTRNNRHKPAEGILQLGTIKINSPMRSNQTFEVCPESLCNLYPLWYSKPSWTWPWKTRSTFEAGPAFCRGLSQMSALNKIVLEFYMLHGKHFLLGFSFQFMLQSTTFSNSSQNIHQLLWKYGVDFNYGTAISP